MICDSHIHIGQFYDIYTSPKQLVGFLDMVGIDRFAVSSTTICEENYEKVLNELTELTQMVGKRTFPILWVVPKMLEDGGLDLFLSSEIRWNCLKIHPQLHPKSWSPRGKNVKRIIQLAAELKCPVLIHTGEHDCCHAGLYKNLASHNQNVKFILAHGRPLSETIDVMKSCSNVYTDTAFMPTNHIVQLCSIGLGERVLWGTDYPIPRYYYREKNMHQYYSSLVSTLRNKATKTDFEKITALNFNKLF